MKLPLRVASKVGFNIPIADANCRIVCTVTAHADADMIADRIVKAINKPRWWHRFRINKPYTRDDWMWGRPFWATPDYTKPTP